MVKKIFSILSILLCGIFLLGNIYFWTDEDGTRHFSNVTLPEGKSVEELKESNTVYQKLNSPKNKTQTFNVLKVYDGDTIQVKGLGLIFKIRMVGIDAPEIGYEGQESQPFSQRSKKYLQTFIDQKQVLLKSYGIGGYNRQLAEVFLDDKNINLEIIRAGLAEVYQGKLPKTLDSKSYLEEELKAKNARVGMWVQTSSYKSPKVWRKEHPRK
ncbi:MAG: thermonuclease family protein [Pseudomonadota bacterium]